MKTCKQDGQFSRSNCKPETF